MNHQSLAFLPPECYEVVAGYLRYKEVRAAFEAKKASSQEEASSPFTEWPLLLHFCLLSHISSLIDYSRTLTLFFFMENS